MQAYIAPHRHMSIRKEQHLMSGSRLHSINESRARLGNIGRDAVYDLLNSGQLEAKKIGRRTLVTDESLETCIQNLPPFLRRYLSDKTRQRVIPAPAVIRRRP
jgi:hypothetical protein